MDLQAKKYVVFTENKQLQGTIEAKESTELIISGGGVLILGQGQGFLAGKLDVLQSFEGILAGYSLAFSKVTHDLIMSYLSCKINEIGTAEVIFKDMKFWNTSGSVNIRNFSRDAICKIVAIPYSVFPVRFGYEKAVSTCQKINGQIVVPKNALENRKLFELIEQKYPSCHQADDDIIAWIGAKKMMTQNGTLKYRNLMTDEILTYTNVQYDAYSAKLQNECLFLENSPEGYWKQKNCLTRSCLVCSFEKRIVYRVRGRGDDSEIDRQFVINGTYNGRPMFIGLSGTIIRAANSTWELVDALNPFLKGHIIPAGQITPVGRQTWIIEQGSQGRTVQKELLLTACNPTQYTCRDGYCIDRKFRCDLEANCPDQSDEYECLIIKIPDGYLKNVSPPKKCSQVVSVYMSANILAMQPLDILSMNLELSAKIVMEWRDSRLQMQNLNEEATQNVILRPDKFWTPALFFEDEYNSEVDTQKLWSFLVVLKKSKALPDDNRQVQEDSTFMSEHSPIRLEQIFKLKMFCFLSLAGYPFDTQTCTFTIRIMETPKNLLAFNTTASSIVYNGPGSIGEYSLEKIEMLDNDRGNYTGKSIRLTLRNLSAYHVTVSFIPTVIMVAICYSTFYYHLDDFNDRIMVSLTSLLVLTTLFTQITENTPKTAYLQFLDIWFVSATFYAFIVVILLVTINFFKIREGLEEFTPVSQLSLHQGKNEKNEMKNQRLSKRINSVARQVMPVVGVLFILAYFITAYSVF
ncbi:Low-density lipoprotein (LDL) receptor class A repeat [Trinorchestia longiramus]|nr:Low-density lipoprotein (LDL) receptor class A repeat [Trinorchestia longiramus]